MATRRRRLVGDKPAPVTSVSGRRPWQRDADDWAECAQHAELVRATHG